MQKGLRKISKPADSKNPRELLRNPFKSCNPVTTMTLKDGSYARSQNWRYVVERGVEYVKLSEDCDAMDVDGGRLESFSPKEYGRRLKKAGYSDITNLVYIAYGKNMNLGLCVYNLKGYEERMWQTEIKFGAVLGKKYVEKFKEDAEKRKSKEEDKNEEEDKNTDEDENEDGDEDGNEDEDEDGDEDYEGRHDEVEYESEDLFELDDDASNDDDDASNDDDDASDDDGDIVRSIESDDKREKHQTAKPISAFDSKKKPLAAKPTSAVDIKKKIPRTTGEYIYACTVIGQLWALHKGEVYNLDRIKSMHPSIKCVTHKQEHKGFAPLSDAEYITHITALKPLKHKLLGCAGFPYGKEDQTINKSPTVWKVVVLELEGKQKEALQKHRLSRGCHYEGPVLLSWTVFQAAVKGKGKAKALKDALTMFARTDYGRKLKKDGIDPKNVRHVTIADDFRVIHDKLGILERSMEERDQKADERARNTDKTLLKILNSLRISSKL
jgi:hypothetical protein